MIEGDSGFVQSPDGTPIAWFQYEPRAGAKGGAESGLAALPPAVILVHGATADHTAFRVVGPILGERGLVIAIDRRGRGLSGDEPPYAIEREYEDLAAVVDWLSSQTAGPVDVVGHSFGGRVGLGAARLTGNLRRLVVYEGAPAAPGQAYQDSAMLARLDALEAGGDFDGLMAAFMGEVVGLSPEGIEAYRTSPTWPIRAAASPTALRELRAESGRDASAEHLAEVQIPVLQLVGGDSRRVFTDGIRVLDGLLANGRVVVLPGQRHAAHHTDPAGFVAAVEAFLDEANPGDAVPSHHE
jgi:pimeloyl-ACP methyl ester carboxylesterase